MNKVKIQEVLGRNYSTKIIEHLVNKGFTAPRGGILTQKVIQDIVAGRTINIPLMEEINTFIIATETKLEKIKNALK